MSARFPRISDKIDFRRLERETYRLLYIGLFVSVLFHSSLFLVVTFDAPPVEMIKPLPLSLIIRPPRNNNPFVIGNRTPLQRQRYRKQFVPAEIDGLITKSQETLVTPYDTTDYADSLDIGYEQESDFHLLAESDSESPVRNKLEYDQPIKRIPGRLFSLRDEMLTAEDFMRINEGQFKGLVFYNPMDKMTIRGIISVPRVWSSKVYQGSPMDLSTGVEGLMNGLSMFTDISMPTDKNNIKNITLNQNTSIDYPFIYIAVDSAWEYFPFEVESMREYLNNGGFVLFDNLLPWLEIGPAEASLRGFIKDVLGPGVRFTPITVDHPLYHCFFDFDDGPPIGSELTPGKGTIIRAHPYLEGIWVDNRLVAVYSNKGYGLNWAARENNEPQLRMGVNMVVFALLREGGNADKRVDYDLPQGRLSLLNRQGLY